MVKTAFNNKRELLKRKISKDLKKRVIKTIFWSVALYRSEIWTLRQGERNRLEASRCGH